MNPPLYYTAKKTFLYLVLIFSVASSRCQAQADDKPWSNPILIYGTSFGNIFQQLCLTGDYQSMLKLTAKESRTAFGDSVILNYYAQMQFAYPIKLISYSRSNGKYQLIYKTYINATVHKIKMDIIVVNDSARIILPAKFHESKYFILGY